MDPHGSDWRRGDRHVHRRRSRPDSVVEERSARGEPMSEFYRDELVRGGLERLERRPSKRERHSDCECGGWVEQHSTRCERSPDSRRARHDEGHWDVSSRRRFVESGDRGSVHRKEHVVGGERRERVHRGAERSQMDEGERNEGARRELTAADHGGEIPGNRKRFRSSSQLGASEGENDMQKAARLAVAALLRTGGGAEGTPTEGRDAERPDVTSRESKKAKTESSDTAAAAMLLRKEGCGEGKPADGRDVNGPEVPAEKSKTRTGAGRRLSPAELWEQADLGGVDRQHKFLKLMGMRKSGATASEVSGESKTHAQPLAISHGVVSAREVALEQQFEKSRDILAYGKGRGLGSL